MYKIVVVGLKQVFEAEYYKALGLFYELIRTTDYNVMLYKYNGSEYELLSVGGTDEEGTKTYMDLVRNMSNEAI